MNFEDVKSAVAGNDRVLIVDNVSSPEINVNEEVKKLRSEEVDMLVWSSKNLRFNHRQNPAVLEAANEGAWEIYGDCLVVCRNVNDLQAFLNFDAKEVVEPEPEPEEDSKDEDEGEDKKSHWGSF